MFLTLYALSLLFVIFSFISIYIIIDTIIKMRKGMKKSSYWYMLANLFGFVGVDFVIFLLILFFLICK